RGPRVRLGGGRRRRAAGGDHLRRGGCLAFRAAAGLAGLTVAGRGCPRHVEDWSNDLATAQRDKLDMICRKLRLEPGERFLDIGCGWGALVCHVAMHHGVRAHGTTLAEDYSGVDGKCEKIVETRARTVGPAADPGRSL